MQPHSEQLSKEWFDARKGKITASNVGAILGLSPYKKPDDVMREMVRAHFGAEREFTGNAATQWGVDNEPNALAMLGVETGEFIERCGFTVSPVHPWLGASPDGLIGSDTVVEVKCPYNKEVFSLDSRPDYMAQIQTQMFVAGRSKGIFAVWVPGYIQITPVDFDQAWQDESIPVLADFYACYQEIIADKDKAAPYLEDAVQDMSGNSEWADAARIYKELKAEHAALDAMLKQKKDRLIELANGRKSQGGGVLVYPIAGKTTTDYKRLLSDHPEIDTAEYRQQGKQSWGIR